MTRLPAQDRGLHRPSVVARLRALPGDRGGATAVEFGLIAIPFMLTLVAVFEIGFSFFMAAALDNAARSSARAVMTGAVSTAGLTASQFRTQLVCPKLPAPFLCGNVFVNLTLVPQGQSPSGYYAYVNAAGSGLTVPPLNASSNSFCPGSGSQYVVVQILYPVSFFTAFFARNAQTTYNGQPVHVLMSTATFKTEPYSGAAAYQGC